MQYVDLGITGMTVSRICVGCGAFGNASEWHIEIDQVRPLVERALDLGINYFDTANSYSTGRSEEIIGELLKGVRDEVVIATKVYMPMGEGPNDRGLSRHHISMQIEGSLNRLQTGYVDLYQIHRWDSETPIEETLATLDNLVRQGKVRYIGASSMYAWQFCKALWISDRLGLEKFVSMQNNYNLLYREEEREMIPLCKDQGIAVIPYNPLARGLLTGKYQRGQTPDGPRYQFDQRLRDLFNPMEFDILDRVREVAKNKGVTAAQIALAWLLQRGVTAPIVGITQMHHLEEAVESFTIHLSDNDMRYLEELYQPHRVVGPV
jgi:aryl-alcohol dehydrogenase-like predicted oxidoreductase